ncbi:MAG: TMEM175 family protein [Bacteroidota bacterium]|nr:TMEM175 family protein [Bacteroidota bacterium]
MKQFHSHIEKHPKQNFQVERLAFFSDAVFAIAITLLIIEFKVPEVNKSSTYQSVYAQLYNLRYNLFSLLVSFTLISKYWIRHHFIFKHIHNYNKRMIIANLIMLLPIIFFPFTTNLFGESLQNNSVIMLAFRVFLANHILALITMYIFYRIVFHQGSELANALSQEEKIKFITDVAYLTFAFIIIFILTLITPNRQLVLWVTISLLFAKSLLKIFVTNKFFQTKNA